jgi:hypothetical protein
VPAETPCRIGIAEESYRISLVVRENVIVRSKKTIKPTIATMKDRHISSNCAREMLNIEFDLPKEYSHLGFIARLKKLNNFKPDSIFANNGFTILSFALS